jgi:endonuclease/exonuclease/phosphatase family metal-dependent hydrolase
LLCCWWLFHFEQGEIPMLLEFGPRWISLAPLLVIAILAVSLDSKFWAVVFLGALLVAGPLLGLCVTSQGLSRKAPPPQSLCLLTLNTDGRASPADVLRLIEREKPHVICLQECYRPEGWYEILGNDWHIRRHREFIVASRFPLSELEPITSPRLPEYVLPAVSCEVLAPEGAFNLICVHLPSMRDGLEAILDAPLDGASALDASRTRHTFAAEAVASWATSRELPVVLAGDFNQVEGTSLYRKHWGNMANAFSSVGLGWGATFHSRWHGIRIDHILASKQWFVVDCHVHDDVGADHRPVSATLSLARSPE